MENFIVSARKYRPATFESVVGQEHITSTLRNAISRGQLAHAYLFCGPRGVGKTTCARIFAKAINCLAPGDGGTCGECESCRSFNEGRSFNIHELDAASNNSVDDIRSLTEQVRIPPQIGRYSVYIIDEVHMLSAAAFNAFLKTLEEPPAHAIFILATTEKHKIIPTILSRCQIYDFNRIRVEDGVKYLKYIAVQEKVTCDDESLHLIAQKADGGMRDALSMFDKAVSFCGAELDFRQVAATLNVLDYDTYFNITDSILAGDYPAALTVLDEVLRKGFSPQTFAAGINSHFRDLLMCRDPQTSGLLEVTGSLMERYKAQAARCETDFLFDALSLVTTIDNGLRIATNQRLNVELGLMKLCGRSQKKNLSSEHELASELSLASVSPIAKPAVNSGTANTPVNPVNPPVQSAPVVDQTVNIDKGEPDKEPAPIQESTPLPVPPLRVPSADNDLPEAEPSPEKSGAAEEVMASYGEVPPVSNIPETDSPKKTSLTAAPRTARPTFSGPAISDLLGKPVGTYDQPAGEDDQDKALPSADASASGKIEAAREKFIKRLNAGRPRLAMAFHGMKVSGNTIKVAVPTRELHDEIVRNRIEILTLLSEVAHIDGYMQLEVEIREDDGPKRPVKIEDKIKFLTEKNPALNLLRQKLDMDFE